MSRLEATSHCGRAVMAAGSEIMEMGVHSDGVSLMMLIPLIPSLSHQEVSVDSIYVGENCMFFFF